MMKKVSFLIGLSLFCGAAFGQVNDNGGGLMPNASNVVLPAGRDAINAGLIQRSVLDFGAKCDVINTGNATYTIPAGSTTLTLSSGSFAFPRPAGAAVWKAALPGHSTAGATLLTTLMPTSATTATLGSPSIPGTISEFYIDALVANAGTSGNYTPGGTGTLTGGTLAPTGGANAVVTYKTTKVAAATIKTAGAGGTNGTYLVYGTTGNGNRAVFSLTVAGGVGTAVSIVATGTDTGHYTTNPTGTPSGGLIPESVATNATGFTLPAGLVLNLRMGIDLAQVTTPGLYSNGGVPSNPVSLGSSSDTGVGATFTMTPAFNHGGFAYGTDDSAALTTAFNPPTWTNPVQTGATVTVPGSICGVASTVTISGDMLTIMGIAPGKIRGQATNNPQGSAFQWLGAVNGTMLSWGAPAGQTTGNQNRISGLAFECGTPSASNQIFSIPLAGIGLRFISLFKAEADHLYFDACSNRDFDLTTSGVAGSDTFGGYYHDLDFWNPLTWDGIGIYQAGNTNGVGDSDYSTFARLTSSYANRPTLYLATLDNTIVDSVHFFQRGNGAANWYGFDMAGSVFGSGDPQPPQPNTLTVRGLSSKSVMRGLESVSVAVSDIWIEGYDAANSGQTTVLMPGHAQILWVDTTGIFQGADGGAMFVGGADGTTGPLAGFVESNASTGTCRANLIANGGAASAYFCNGSNGSYMILDNVSGTSRWGIGQNGVNLYIARLAGSGVFQILGNNGDTARIGDPGSSGFTAMAFNGAATFNLANANLFGSNGDSDFYINRPTGGALHFRENNGTDQLKINTSTGLVTVTSSLSMGSVTPLTLTTGELGMAKITASGTAPGAAGVKVEWVCGTNPGTAKWIAYAGTSTTPSTLVDNIGAGVTGC